MLKLGHYLGPSIYVGPAMTIKILKENRQVLHRSALLIPDELLDKDGSDDQETFVIRVYEKLGLQVMTRELDDVGQVDTPQYDLYGDETENKQTFPQLIEELELTPEVGDHSTGADMLLLRGHKMARGS